jgi:hypothetical protein
VRVAFPLVLLLAGMALIAYVIVNPPTPQAALPPAVAQEVDSSAILDGLSSVEQAIIDSRPTIAPTNTPKPPKPTPTLAAGAAPGCFASLSTGTPCEILEATSTPKPASTAVPTLMPCADARATISASESHPDGLNHCVSDGTDLSRGGPSDYYYDMSGSN